MTIKALNVGDNSETSNIMFLSKKQVKTNIKPFENWFEKSEKRRHKQQSADISAGWFYIGGFLQDA